MNKITLLGLLALIIGTLSCGKKTAAPQSEDEKIIYAIGLSIGKSIKRFEIPKDQIPYLFAGIEAELTEATPAIKFEEYGPKIREFTERKMMLEANKEKEESQKFVDQILTQPGYMKTDSGLIYKITQEGSGTKPTVDDVLKVHYHGTLRTGKVFDSSVERKEPAQFPLKGVIPCWQEGMTKVGIGGKIELICPAHLAYGDRGNPTIPGGSALKFEVELLEIVKQEAPKKEAPKKK